MKKQAQTSHNVATDKQRTSAKHKAIGDHLDENTTLDLFISPVGYITELSDTVDSMDGAKTEVVDMINEADGTNIEVTIIEEPTNTPGLDHVDRIIEVKGIGPKVAELLMNAGIRKFSQLAETPVEQIREILASAGTHYRIYDPTTWPKQAKQLADSKPNPINRPATGQL